MKVKKYVGETIQDTIFKVKADLGPEAIILNTRKFKKGGFLGFFTKERVEVLAALEDPDKGIDNSETLNELNNLKDMVSNLEQKWDQSSFIDNLDDELKKIYEYLHSQSVREDLIQGIINDFNNKEMGDQSSNKKRTLQLIYRKMLNILGEQAPIDSTCSDNKGKVIAFVGPTGVGKTTTIAKLAAKFAVEDNVDVGLVTSDTYRIAAVQQLETYSDIMDIPLEVVYDESELAENIRKNQSNYDLTFVDTAGSSWNDQMQMGRLKKFTDLELVDETHLLISLNTKRDDLHNIIEHFSRLKPDKILLTKLDETSSYGEIINLRQDYDLPYSYITNGQDVPDDIKEADNEILLNYVIGDLYE